MGASPRGVVFDFVQAASWADQRKETERLNFSDPLARRRLARFLGPQWGVCWDEEVPFPSGGPFAHTPVSDIQVLVWERRPLDLELELGLLERRGIAYGSQNVAVLWNGKRLGDFQLNWGDDITKHTLPVPEELVRLGENKVSLVCLLPSKLENGDKENGDSPVSLGDSLAWYSPRFPSPVSLGDSLACDSPRFRRGADGGNPWARRSFALRSLALRDPAVSAPHGPVATAPPAAAWTLEPRTAYDFACVVPAYARLEVSAAGISSNNGSLLLQLDASPSSSSEFEWDTWDTVTMPQVDLSRFDGQTVRFRWIAQRGPVSLTEARITTPTLREGGPQNPAPADPGALPRQGAAKRPNVIMVLFDAWGAGHAGCYGYYRDTTPNIDHVARNAVVFDNAYATASYTVASVPSLFTGLYPFEHRVVHQLLSPPLHDRFKTMAEAFSEAGYHTCAISASPFIRPLYGTTQGFEEVQSLCETVKETIRPGPILAETVVARALEWLESSAEQPFFAYLHVMEPHAPYNPPGDWKAFFDPDYTGPIDGSRETLDAIRTGNCVPTRRELDHLTALYDANLRYADDCIGRLFKHLETSGLAESTIVLLTADHGEAFMEHGEIEHSSTVYPEMTHVPLIVRFPERFNIEPKRLPDVVSLTSVYPTLAEFCELPLPDYPLHGVSLAPAIIEGTPLPDDGVYMRRIEKTWTFPHHAVRTGNALYIMDAGSFAEELYMIRVDPDCLHNVVEHFPGEALALRTRIASWLATGRTATEVPVGAESIELDRATEEELRALGYLE